MVNWSRQTYFMRLFGGIISLALICLLFDAVNGCIGDNGPSFGVLNPLNEDAERSATEVSFVKSTIPEGGATDVDVRAVIKITFFEAMDKSTINETTVKIADSHEVPASFTIDYEETSFTAILTLKDRLTLESTYTVTVSADVKTKTGKSMTSPYTWNFITRDGAWETEIKSLKDRSTPRAANPEVAMNLRGDAMVVWQQKNTGEASAPNSIWAKGYKEGTGWNQTVSLLENQAGDATNPKIGMDSAGNALVIWEQKDSAGAKNIFSNYYKKDYIWVQSSAAAVAGCSGQVSGPRVSMSGNGDVFIVWQEQTGSNEMKINGNHCTVDQACAATGVFRIDNDDVHPASVPHVASNVSGGSIIAWAQESKIFARRYVGGTLENKEEIFDSDVRLIPDVAISDNDNGLTVWSENEHVWVARYITGVGWDAAPYKIDNGSGPAVLPSVAMAGNCNPIVVFVQDGKVWYNRFNGSLAEGAWDTAIPISEGTDGLSSPSIAMSANCSAIAVWEQGGEIMARSFQ